MEAAALLLAHCGPSILEAVDSSGRSALDIAIYQVSQKKKFARAMLSFLFLFIKEPLYILSSDWSLREGFKKNKK